MTPIDGAPVLTAAQMRAAEDAVVARGGSIAALMQEAGRLVGDAVYRLAGNNDVLVLCGPGNNGGDGYLAAGRLRALGHKVRVAAIDPDAPGRGPAAEGRAAWGGAIEPLATAAPAPVLVDALFGTGLLRPLPDTVAAALRRLVVSAQLSIAVDLPSGVVTDDGSVPGDRATPVDVTLALGAVKPSHVLLPAAIVCGEVRLLDIGVAPRSDVEILARESFSAPGDLDHKYTRGMVAVIAGAMPGAAALAAGAAAHVAGYVLLLGSATDRLPHAIVRRRFSGDALGDDRIGAVVIGPGLGRDDTARAKLDAALASGMPLVIDGDALHLLDPARLRDHGAPVILTPHAGEFAAMFGDADGSKVDRAMAAARDCGATIVFKGADTVVAHPGGQVRIAASRRPWLATAGTGDVLAGVTGALLAHLRDPLVAASDAVWLHGEAARVAGPAFIADDLIAAIPRALETAI